MKRIIFLIFIILLTGCSNNDSVYKSNLHYKNSKTLIKNDDPKAPIGMELGFFDESSIDEDQVIHKVDKNEIYSPKISVGNYFQETFKFGLFFLIDYKQIPVITDEKVSFIDVKLKPDEKRDIDVELPKSDLKQGLHDLIVILVRDPENTLNKNQFVSEDQVYLSRRVALIVENGQTSPVNYKAVSSQESKDIISSPIITKKINGKPRDYLSFISSKDNVFLNFGSNKNDKRFAIIGIINSKQIKLELPYLLAKTKGNMSLPISFYEYKKELPANALIAIIDDPFTLDKNNLIQQKIQFTNLITLKK
ncbi:MAG: hypothetical protein ABF649_15940 [Bacillus sp. (in: firmicutes)]